MVKRASAIKQTFMKHGEAKFRLRGITVGTVGGVGGEWERVSGGEENWVRVCEGEGGRR
jgi:hypothetical protein